MTGGTGTAGPAGTVEEELEQRFDASLAEERLLFQRCRTCHHGWLPPRAECPRCLEASWDVETASGQGRLISWVTYHRAYSPELADRVPYDVAVVELDEGPRLVSHLAPGSTTASGRAAVDARGSIEYVQVGETWLTRFRLDG